MLGLFSTVSVGRNGVSGLRHGAQRGGWQIALVGAIALLSVSNASAALQHQWTFEGGNANDPIGGANGTLMNGAVVTGGALVLTGGGAGAGATSPHATLPGPTIAINTFTSGLTLELWMTGSVENQWIWGAGLGRTSIGENEETAGQGYDYLMMNTSRQPAVEGSRMAISNGNFNGEAGVTDPSMDDLGDGLVHHVVLTVDPGAATPQMEYFLDGASIGTAALGDISIANLSNDTAYLGRSLYDGDSVFTGSIHEFSIYDNPFDLATAQANFTTGPVGGVPGVGPALEIDRDTGNVRLTNDQGSVSVVAYTINSAAGAIANANWASVANTGDSNSGGSIDPDDVWTIVTDTPNEISEADLVGGVGPDDGFALGTEQSLGNGLWTKSPFEDFTASLTTYDGVNELTFNAPVFFVGNNDLPFNIADFNLDNAVNAADYQILLDNAHTTLVGTTPLETQPFGDLDGDLDNDFFDYRMFEQLFNDTNGTGSFSAMVAGVPEPGTALLFCAAVVLGGLAAGRRRLASGCVAGLVALAFLAGGTTSHADTIAWWDFESDLGGTAANGVAVSHPGANAEFNAAIPDLSGNDNHLSTYAPNSPIFSSTVSPNATTGTTLSAQNGGSVGFRTDGNLQVGGSPIGSLAAWTLEASIQMTNNAGWQTLIGQDGHMHNPGGTAVSYLDTADGNVGTGGTDNNQAGLYLQKAAATGTWRINFIASDGSAYIMDGTSLPVANQWYNVAATSDGTTLKLYVDGFVEKEMNMVARNGGAAATDLVMVDDTGMTTQTPPAPYSWSVARGYYGGNGLADPVQGQIDDVRISDEALDPTEFLNGPPLLQLYVNTNDGEARIVNASTGSFTIDYYQVDSPTSGALQTGADWNSLSEQNLDPVDGGDELGETWEEVTSSGANLLAEQFLLGETTINPGGQLSLGEIYNLGVGGQDLEWRFSGKTQGAALSRSFVQYVTEFPPLPEGVAGDYNDDGVVNAADYVFWKNRDGTDAELANRNPALMGDVGQADYEYWVANYGNGLSGSGNGSTAVPEPVSALLGILAAAGLLAASSRHRKIG